MEGTDEEFVPEEEVEQGPAALKSLREKLKKAVAEKQEYLDGWQRTRADFADFANYKREEAKLETLKEVRIQAGVVETLLPVLDSLEMAFKQAQSKELNLIHKQLLDALRGLGAEPFGKEGERFDPRLHHALAQKGEGETLLSIERSGYKIGDTIIRPAQVII
jgi:molecular chaperone GrpE